MKAKINNGFFELVRFKQATVQNILHKDFPINIGYWIGYFFDEVNRKSVVYFREKEKLFEKYARKDKNGKIKVDKETQKVILKNTKAFNKDLVKLQRIEIPISVDKIKVNLDVLERRGILLKPFEFNFINPIFDVETQQEEKEKTPPENNKKKKLHRVK